MMGVMGERESIAQIRSYLQERFPRRDIAEEWDRGFSRRVSGGVADNLAHGRARELLLARVLGDLESGTNAGFSRVTSPMGSP